MSGKNHDEGRSATRWFLKKFFSTPAAYMGLAVAAFVGSAGLGAGIPWVGSIGLGVMIGFVAGLFSFLIAHGIKASHQKAMNSLDDDTAESIEKSVLESLRSSGQADDAELLERLFGDRNAILKQSQIHPENADAAHTLTLVAAIVIQACRQAEEMQDLVRRREDPLLDSPVESGQTIEEIRADLRRAYQAVADARSRLRRGDPLEEIDFLAAVGSMENLPLPYLSGQLEEETSLSRRVEQRLNSTFKSGIVSEVEKPVDSGTSDLLETE